MLTRIKGAISAFHFIGSSHIITVPGCKTPGRQNSTLLPETFTSDPPPPPRHPLCPPSRSLISWACHPVSLHHFAVFFSPSAVREIFLHKFPTCSLHPRQPGVGNKGSILDTERNICRFCPVNKAVSVHGAFILRLNAEGTGSGDGDVCVCVWGGGGEAGGVGEKRGLGAQARKHSPPPPRSLPSTHCQDNSSSWHIRTVSQPRPPTQPPPPP